MRKVDFSIVIINFQTAKLVGDLLRSWIKTKSQSLLSWEIIIVDNNSPEAESELFFLKKIIAELKIEKLVKLLANQQNLGFGGANNQAAKISQGEWLWFLNSDTLVSQDELVPLQQFIEHNPNAKVISPQLVTADGQPQKFAFGSFPTLKSLINQKEKNQNWQPAEPLSVDWVTGAAMLVEKDAFNQVGGFDKDFFMYYEDIDLCYRIKKLAATNEIMVLSTVRVTHLGGQSLQHDWTRYQYYFAGQTLFAQKHWSKKDQRALKFWQAPIKKLRRWQSRD